MLKMCFEEQKWRFICLHMDVQLCPHRLLKGPFSSIVLPLNLIKNQLTAYVWVYSGRILSLNFDQPPSCEAVRSLI